MISVIMPAYNRENVIAESINSVLNQSYSDLELIIVDDGSTDNTKDIVQSIRDDRIKYYYQENAGACVARNYGIDLAKGEYIAFHDSDDIWHADKLEKQIEVFRLHKEVDLVFCKLQRIKNHRIDAIIPASSKNGVLNPIIDLFGIGTQTLIAKRTVFLEHRFDVDMPRFQEFELLLRISKNNVIYCLDEGLVDYYIGEDSISSNPKKLLNACEMILKKHPGFSKEYPVMASIMSGKLQREALQLCGKGDNSYINYYRCAYNCNRSKKIIIKMILGKIGLLNKVFK